MMNNNVLFFYRERETLNIYKVVLFLFLNLIFANCITYYYICIILLSYFLDFIFLLY